MKKLLLLVSPFILLLGLITPVVAQDEEPTVQTAESDEYGTYLVDSEGMALYLFTNDSPGTSTCYDQCAENWPPFTAEEPLTLPDGVPGELTTIERDDGTQQVAYNGWPLYYWVQDEEPGDTTGHGVGDVWYLVEPTEPGATPIASPAASPEASPVAAADTTVAVTESDELGEYLVDSEGMTLYLFTQDSEGVSNCAGDCLANWPAFTAEEPLTLPEGVEGELTLIERDDGTQQVAYNGWPLYYYVDDQAPGDTTGHHAGDVWYVVAPGQEPPPAEPASES